MFSGVHMSRAALFPNVTLNQSISFIPPIEPDFWDCDKWYSRFEPPTFADCQIAWTRLTPGEDVEHYFTNAPEWEPYQLPVIVSHDTCQIEFHASGNYSYYHTQELLLAPNTIRYMAGYVIRQCIEGENSGGYVTKGIEKPIDYLSDINNTYPGYLPGATTFFTATVLSSSVTPAYEPGCCDPVTGKRILRYVDEKVLEEPAGSVLREKLEERVWYLAASVRRMQRFNYRAWWIDPFAPLSLPNTTAVSSYTGHAFS